ncbi:MAG: hypothetical protein AB1941_11655 [Gemmatimonadota bacterium]
MSPATARAVRIGHVPIVGGGLPTPVESLFQGYDTFSGSARADAVLRQARPPVASSRLRYQVCTGADAVYRALRIPPSAQASLASGAAGGRAAFARSLELTRSTVSVLVYASVERTHSCGRPPLAPGVPTADLLRFFRTYGDAYVSSLTTGAEYAAVHAFHLRSPAERERLLGMLSVHGIGWGGDVGAPLQAALDRLRRGPFRQELRQLVTGAAGAAAPEPSGVVLFAQCFGCLPHDAPAVLAYRTTGYEHVPGMPDFGAVPQNRALIERRDGRAGIVTRRLSALRSAVGRTTQPAGARSGGSPGEGAASGWAGTIRADTAALRTCVSTLAEDPTRLHPQPSLPEVGPGTRASLARTIMNLPDRERLS